MTKNNIFIEACKHIESDSFKTLLKMQLLHRPGIQWQEDEKQLALELFYRSPALYNNLREDKGFNLPTRNSISRWLNVTNLMPGISDELLERLKFNVKNMSSVEKNVTLVFDEMSIKRTLSYNEKRDLIEGFEDMGSLGRTNKVGDHAVLFLVRGLISKWKMPIAYYISASSVPGATLVQLLKECLSALSDIGLKVRAVVCDQGSNNRNVAAALQVSKECPHFTHDGNKIFYIYDIPHIFKSIRNCLMKSNIQHEGSWAKWSDIVELYDLDMSGHKARSLCKLTPKHLAPNSFDKMKVKLATQVFSHSVQAAMLTAVETSQLPPDAVNTASFVGKMNDIFDCLNSKVQFDPNPLRCAISSTTSGLRVIETLKSALPYITSWKREKKTKRTVENPPCFSGLISTITAILQLWEDLEKEGILFLLTNRLTQDALENEFSIARQRCGYERNPSAMQFRQNLRHRIHLILMKPPVSSNCEVDEDRIVTTPSDCEAVTDTEEEEDGGDEDDETTREVLVMPERQELVHNADHDDSTDDDGIDETEMEVDHPQHSSVLQPTTLETCSVQ